MPGNGGDAIRRADLDEIATISGILTEAADWLRARGEPLWTPEELAPSAIAADVRAGLYVLASVRGHGVGVVRVADEDPLFWPDATPSEALYIHRLAVRRAHSGGSISRSLVDWVGAHARALGRAYVRLDCEAHRRRLRALYERYGFVFHGERTVGAHRVARYQRPTLTPP